MLVLYTNGDSHTAGAEALNTFAFAEDDYKYQYLGRKPHPENFAVSWSSILARRLDIKLHTDAESASSNTRIMRTTKDWIEQTKDDVDASQVLMILQWSTWEREEWLINGTYYQVNASGIDIVPSHYRETYKQWIADIDWVSKTYKAYQDIIEFDQYLTDLGYKHIFFNGNNSFFDIPEVEQEDFGDRYINPYLPEYSFDGWLQSNGYATVPSSNYHFGPEAHAAWAGFLLEYIREKNIL